MGISGRLTFNQGLSDLTGFEQDGREFAVVGLIDSIAAAFVDITDPENPVEVGRISGTPSNWRDLKYWNRHVYIGTQANDGIKVISVNDPDNPTLVHTIDSTSSHNIHIDTAGFLYVVGTPEALEHGMWIYDLTTSEFPTLLGTWKGEGEWKDYYLHDIEVYNNKVYGAAIYSGYFYIIDVSDKTNPTTLISHDTGGGYISTHDCAITYDEHYLITADERRGGHLKIWDILDYENINLISEYMTHPDHSVHNVYIRPETNLVIMSYYVDGTRILDITDPANPVEVGYYDTSDLTGLYDGNWGTYAYLPSGYIVSSDRQNGLFIFDSPLTSSSMEWSACPDCFGVLNGGAYVDDCGICSEGNTGHVANSDQDSDGCCPGFFDLGCGCGEDAMSECEDGTFVCNQVDCPPLNIANTLIPDKFTILKIYPNPFNPITYLTFSLPQSDFVSIKIMDTMGKVLETPIHQFITAGYHSINWDASNYSSGVYFIRMDSGGFTQIQKVVLLK